MDLTLLKGHFDFGVVEGEFAAMDGNLLLWDGEKAEAAATNERRVVMVETYFMVLLFVWFVCGTTYFYQLVSVIKRL